jgi:hypothetical protein
MVNRLMAISLMINGLMERLQRFYIPLGMFRLVEIAVHFQRTHSVRNATNVEKFIFYQAMQTYGLLPSTPSMRGTKQSHTSTVIARHEAISFLRQDYRICRINRLSLDLQDVKTLTRFGNLLRLPTQPER